jgi:hypothetical protein
MNNESMNDIEDSTRHEFMEDLQENTSTQAGLRQETRHERQVQENKVPQDWQESQNQLNQEIEETSLQRDQTDYQEEQQERTSVPYSQQGREGEYQLSQKQNYHNPKDDERELEREIEDDRVIELDREKDQLILERRKLQLQQKQDQEQQLQMQVQQRQENEQKQLQLQLQLHLQQHQQIQQQQQLLLLQDQQELLQHQHQHRQQQLLQHHHQQLLLPHHFEPDQDDDVLKEAAFAYSTVGSNTPPLSPTGKTNKYTSAHSIIGTSNTFGDSNSGAASLFSGTGLNTESRKATAEQHKWMYRDPSGNIQGICIKRIFFLKKKKRSFLCNNKYMVF